MALRDRFRRKTKVTAVSRPVKIYYEPLLVIAIVLLVKEQLNVLRDIHGLAPITNTQVLGAVKDKINQLAAGRKLPPPQWLKDITENG